MGKGRFLILLTTSLLTVFLLIPYGRAQEKTLTWHGSSTILFGFMENAAPIIKSRYGITIKMDASGESNSGESSVISGTAELGGVARELSKEAVEKGIVGTVVAFDGLTVITHPSNPVTQLTTAQVKDIFTGKITNWKELGGKDAKILVFAGAPDIAIAKVFKQMVLNNEEYGKGFAPMKNAFSIAEYVGKTPDAIGHCSFAFMKGQNVKAVSIDGQPATVENLNYPIKRPMLLTTKGAPQGNAKVVIDFILSDEGQKIVKESFIGVGEGKRAKSS